MLVFNKSKCMSQQPAQLLSRDFSQPVFVYHCLPCYLSEKPFAFLHLVKMCERLVCHVLGFVSDAQWIYTMVLLCPYVGQTQTSLYQLYWSLYKKQQQQHCIPIVNLHSISTTISPMDTEKNVERAVRSNNEEILGG